jgi:thiol-disulfide isomerase/thioredoxin
MTNDTPPQVEQPPRSLFVFGALLVAAVAFAAVYVTMGRPDNGQDDQEVEPARSMAAFVRQRPPVELPAISFQDDKGNPLTLENFRGKAVLLNLWATWCFPCREEMPSLDRLQKEMGSDTFEVVALSLDRAGQKASAEFLSETNVEHLRLYVDPTMKTGNKLRAVGMPTTILIDKEGREVGRLSGPAEWDSADAKALIVEALKD